MNSRIRKAEKKEMVDIINMDSFIERLKKARAINCSPLYLGINSDICNRVFNRVNPFTNFYR